MADDARDELKERMLLLMYDRLRAFYEHERPEYYRDERSVIAIARSLDGMRECFAIMGDYEITRRPGPVVVIVDGNQV